MQFRILVADDERKYIDLYSEVLSLKKPFDQTANEANSEPSGQKNEGISQSLFELTSCDQANDAVYLVQKSLDEKRPYAVAFLDVLMPPGPDGIWAGKQIRALDPHIEIVLVTGLSDVTPVAITNEIPPAHKLLYIQKPFNVKEFYHLAYSLSHKWNQEHHLLNLKNDLELSVKERTKEFQDKNVKLKQEFEERKRVGEKLRETQNRMQHVLDISPSIIYSCKIDPDGKPDGGYPPTYVSGNIERLFGYKIEECLNNSNWWPEGVHPEDAPQTFKQFSLLFQNGDLTHEYRFRHKDGSYMWIHDELVLIRDTSGEPIEFVGSWTDITERKRAEINYLESEEKYRSMMEAIKDPVYICSPNFRVEYMNPAMIRRIGRDATGEICHQVIHDFETKCPWCIHETIQIGEHAETTMVSPANGNYYHISHSPIHHIDGSISKMTIFRNITKLKQVETALEDSEKKYRELVENLPQSIVEVNREAKVMFANRHTLEAFGYSREDLALEMSVMQFFVAEDQAIIQDTIARIWRGEKISGHEYTMLRKDGTSISVIIYNSPVVRDNQVVGIRALIVDITERKRANAELKKKTHDLGKRVKELNCLFGMSQLVETKGISLEEIIQGTVDLIPKAWQYPEITTARIVLGDQEFKAKDFRKTKWGQSGRAVLGKSSDARSHGHLSARG